MRPSYAHLPIVTKDDNTDVVRLQVESHTLDSRLELHHLTGLHLGETEDSGDTITDGDDGSEFLEVVLNTGKKWVSCVRESQDAGGPRAVRQAVSGELFQTLFSKGGAAWSVFGKHNIFITARALGKCVPVTYDLVDARDLGLENRDGVSDRGLGVGVGNGRGAERASGQRAELLILAHSRDNFRKHPLIIINLLTMLNPI